MCAFVLLHSNLHSYFIILYIVLTLQIRQYDINSHQKLIPLLKDIVPKDITKYVHDEVGYFLLNYLRQTLGGSTVFVRYLKHFMEKFCYKSINFHDWKIDLLFYFNSEQQILLFVYILTLTSPLLGDLENSGLCLLHFLWEMTTDDNTLFNVDDQNCHSGTKWVKRNHLNGQSDRKRIRRIKRPLKTVIRYPSDMSGTFLVCPPMSQTDVLWTSTECPKDVKRMSNGYPQ
ncbi:Leukotriene A-4 hydrolase [Cyphomyrmex costatus]|uniref:Leukotriene A-4 hydrolase n=1 Tax=Cyphomyrmex costatus TaxID=456900 RepID=A0A151ICR9_9HYME|nr:Leukotriene A-4 hydrolase [Cyphomyrmex costatus]